MSGTIVKVGKNVTAANNCLGQRASRSRQPNRLLKKIFRRLLKNAQVQGPRNPEALKSDKRRVLEPVRRNKPAPCSTRGRISLPAGRQGKRSRWVFFSSLLVFSHGGEIPRSLFHLFDLPEELFKVLFPFDEIDFTRVDHQEGGLFIVKKIVIIGLGQPFQVI